MQRERRTYRKLVQTIMNRERERGREREREKEIDDKKSILSEKNIQYELGGLRLVLNRFGSK